MKKIIILVLSICIVLSFSIEPTYAIKRKAGGLYYASVYGKKGMKSEIMDEWPGDYTWGDKRRIAHCKKKWNFYNEDKKAFFKKYHKQYKNPYSAVVIYTKLKGNRFSTWGTWLRKHSGKKKKYKYNKHVFKLAKNCRVYNGYIYNEGASVRPILLKKKKARKILREPGIRQFTLVIRNGKVQVIYLYHYPWMS